MPKKTSSLGGKSGELSSAELQRVSGGTDATPNTEVVLKKLPGKRKPPTVTL
jgi:hypothetical protein